MTFLLQLGIKGLNKIFISPFMDNVPTRSDNGQTQLKKSRSICRKIFKVCLTILRCYALKVKIYN